MSIAALIRRVAGAERCGGGGGEPVDPSLPRVLVVGNPNVGKSALFNRLTGRYVTVSNYPGTTVEIARGRSRRFAAETEVVDTPGMYSLAPITEEERVARAIFFQQPPKAVVHVIDAKNIQRMLPLTLQLIEADLPVVLALNMHDEAVAAGVRIDRAALQERLGVPVVETVATTGEGVDELVRRVDSLPAPPGKVRIEYPAPLEQALAAIAGRLDHSPAPSARIRALLLLQGDADETERLRRHQGKAECQAVLGLIRQVRAGLDHLPHYHMAVAIKAQADRILDGAVAYPHRRAGALAERLSRFCMNPLTGIPLLGAVLYLGLYLFVGQLGGGTLVNLLENSLFAQRINPWVNRTAENLIAWAPLRELIAGEFGVITLGFRYAVAIILPIVGTFFFAFAILEDSGYLPRLAMLIDRVFKKIGLTGRAVIPIVLGFGCDTMATMVTRTLETRRERIIATFLLALAIPCSAQMGVILGMLAGHPLALVVWAGVIAAVFLLAGVLAARLLPGERPTFYMELPPLRLPRPSNVLVKTYTRIVWYFKEVLPLFVLASVFIWLGRMTGLFQAGIAALGPLVRALGLPDATATAILFGFFRRDYGVAGLYDLHRQGTLSPRQLTVAAVTLTLFLPCIAQFLVMQKERGWKVTLAVSAFIAVFAFAAGFVVNLALAALGVQL